MDALFAILYPSILFGILNEGRTASQKHMC